MGGGVFESEQVFFIILGDKNNKAFKFKQTWQASDPRATSRKEKATAKRGFLSRPPRGQEEGGQCTRSSRPRPASSAVSTTTPLGRAERRQLSSSATTSSRTTLTAQPRIPTRVVLSLRSRRPRSSPSATITRKRTSATPSPTCPPRSPARPAARKPSRSGPCSW